MECPTHEQRMKAVPILKYGNKRVYGTNYYCTVRECKYEQDTRNDATETE